MDLTSDIMLGGGRSSSDSSMVSSLEASVGSFNADTEQLLAESTPTTTRASFRLPRSHHYPNAVVGTNSNLTNNAVTSGIVRRRSSCQIHPETTTATAMGAIGMAGIQRNLNHLAFQSISIEQCEGLDPRGKMTSSIQTVVTVSKLVTPASFQQSLRFLYTGILDPKSLANLPDLMETSEHMDIPELQIYLTNLQRREEFLNVELQQKFLEKAQTHLRILCLEQGIFSDVVFQLDDGLCSAHRPILMARCDMMAAMFRGDFRESSAKVVHFPGVPKDCFYQLLVYLYTDGIDASVIPTNCLELLALANRLCLPRLVALVEKHVVFALTKMTEVGIDATEHTLRLLEPCQMHNADQLADWCLYHIAVNYNDICKKTPKLLRNLHPENQAYLNRNRWPPVWYLKEYDYYERCLRERLWMEKPPKVLKRHRHNSTSGCLCFSGRSRRNGSKRAYRTV